ncbi:CPBP family intramembrane metalloprotease [Candidatus Bathyarchaeota archaeon]|nr:CPBP family intramembrane metalloprotease [Candidatus Bathyarchaeota archaeon]
MPNQKTLLIITWTTTLLVSSLPLIIWREIFGNEPYWWAWITGIAYLMIMSLTFVNESFKQIRGYILILGVIFFLGYGGGWREGLIPLIRNSKIWIELIDSLPWFLSSLAVHLLRLLPAMVILTFSLIKGIKLKDIFLVKGNLDAEVKPSLLLGIKKKDTWKKTGLIFGIIFFLGTFIFLLFTTKLTQDFLSKLIYVIPTAIIIACINGFNEEFTLRAAPLSRLKKAIGEEEALKLTTVFFGLGHYYGVPNGIIGVILSSFLGWFLGKSMLETHGFLIAWLVHILPDIIIFTFFLI